MNQENKTPHNFCETPEEKCTMNYCDENGCQNRKRRLVEENEQLPMASDYIETVYGTKNFARTIAVQDAPSLMGLMENFADHCSKPLREELEKLRAELTTLKVDTTYDITNLTIEKEQLKAKNERLKSQVKSLEFNGEVVSDGYLRLREALEKFAVMGQEGGDLNGEYHVLTSTGTEKYPVSEAVRVTKNILELVNHIAKKALKGGSDE